MISIIAAHANNRVIGAGNDIPWRLKTDFAHFAAYTRGKVVVMGRRTWDSLPVKPLKHRVNVVVSRTLSWQDIDADVFPSLEEAISAHSNSHEIVIIGGGELYRHALDLGIIDRLVISEVDTNVKGDVFFPSLPEGEFHVTNREPIRNDVIPYDIITYDKVL